MINQSNQNTGRQVMIYDTTLRDGMQGIQVSYTLDDKIKIAHALDEMKIDYIEGGFPLSNEKEAAFFRQIRKESLGHAKIVAFGSTRRPGMTAEKDPMVRALVDAETPAVIVVGKTWKAHVETVLKTDQEENLRMIYDSVQFLKSQGRQVFFDLEHFFDGFRDDPAYALQVLQAGSDAGSDCLILCDTNGGTLPGEVTRIIRSLPREKLSPLGGHFHDDCGVAIANSLAAVDEGALQIQGTVNGWGERCGNANLCSFIPNIVLKTPHQAHCAPHIQRLTHLSRFVAEKANIIPDRRMPYVGDAAFTHKAGQHADVINKDSSLMEHIDSRLVGNERRIVLSELAGKSTIVEKLREYGDFTKQSPVVDELTRLLKQKENQGFEYEAAEASFDLLIRRALKVYQPLIALRNYHLESYKTAEMPSKTVGRLFLETRGRELLGASVCVGPVDTLDHALRDALEPLYPWLKKITLSDYRVRVLNPESGVSAKVRVFITYTDHDTTWDTVGVHENIVEASWQALVDAIEFYYNTIILAEEAALEETPG
ncbi:2-isopropylmalate synthase [Alkalispirochaeta americana]|uniref:Citramalate synthase n=1 Tax=Alkalispirochaeta americana TaxID=159291 RepID=A0A1N6R1K8_9SPIO|nr:citramalate synthase [Alkalispirochaeta americana]SIQ22689.1 2-isopropylmalate synthase [Alkalispirochaeta americana]